MKWITHEDRELILLKRTDRVSRMLGDDERRPSNWYSIEQIRARLDRGDEEDRVATQRRQQTYQPIDLGD